MIRHDYDPTDEDDIAAAEADQRAFDAVRLDAWRWMLADPRGRLIVAELLRESGFLRSSLAENPLTMAALEGKRTIGAAIYHIIMMNGAQFWPEIHSLVHQLPAPARSPEKA